MNTPKPGDLILGSLAGPHINLVRMMKLIVAAAEETSYVFVYSDEISPRYRTLNCGPTVSGMKLAGASDE